MDIGATIEPEELPAKSYSAFESRPTGRFSRCEMCYRKIALAGSRIAQK